MGKPTSKATNGITGVTVLNTKHPVTGANGAYFYFDKDERVAVFGPFDSQANYVKVDSWRDGVKIWSGHVNVRDNSNGIHGWKQWAYRRPGVFRAGDILSKPIEETNPPTLASTSKPNSEATNGITGVTVLNTKHP